MLVGSLEKLAEAKADVQAAIGHASTMASGPSPEMPGIKLDCGLDGSVKQEDGSEPVSQCLSTSMQMSDEQTDIMVKAMQLRSQYHQTIVWDTFTQIAEAVQDVVGEKSCYKNHHFGLFLDMDKFETVPWHDSAKYYDKASSCQTSHISTALAAMSRGIFFVALTGMHATASDHISKTVEQEHGTFSADRKTKIFPVFLCKDESAADRSRRAAETVLISYTASFRFFNIQRKHIVSELAQTFRLRSRK